MQTLFDITGKKIQIGDYIEQKNYNGETYRAVYQAVDDGDIAFRMIEGNKKAISTEGLRSLDYNFDKKKLYKGRIIQFP